MEDSTKEMLGGAGLAGAGAAVGVGVPAAVRAVGDAVVDPVERHADMMNRLTRSSLLDAATATTPHGADTLRHVHKYFADKEESAMQALRAAEEARESLAKRWGGSARTAGGLLAAGGLALGAKGIYDRFNKEGSHAALRDLGLEKYANLAEQGAHLFTTLHGPSKLQLSTARASTALHEAQLRAGRLRSMATQGFAPGSAQEYALRSGWSPSSVVRSTFPDKFIEALR